MTGASALLLPDPTVTFLFYSSCLGMQRARQGLPLWPLTSPGGPHHKQSRTHLTGASVEAVRKKKKNTAYVCDSLERRGGGEEGGMEKEKGGG